MRWQRTHLTRVVDASCDALHVRRIDDAVRVDPEHIAAAVSRNAAHRLPSLALVVCDDLAREPAYQLARRSTVSACADSAGANVRRSAADSAST